MPGQFNTDPLDDESDPFTPSEAVLLAAIAIGAVCVAALLALGIWTASRMVGRLLS